MFALCDGETALPLGAAQDHKRVGDGDTGPNTGGMGAYSPTPVFPPALQERPWTASSVPRSPKWRGAARRSAASSIAGLMLTDEGAELIEFNVRFGDPECQALLLRLLSDLLPALQAAYDGELENFDLRWNDTAVDRRGDGGARLSRGAGTRQRNPRTRPCCGGAERAGLPCRHRAPMREAMCVPSAVAC